MNLQGKIRYLSMIPAVYSNFMQGYLSIAGLLDRAKDYTYALRNGIRMQVSGSKWDFFILNEIFIIREYDVQLPFGVKTVVDVGAHKGAASLFFAKKFLGSKIFSIEPFPQNFAALSNNIKLNGLGKQIKPFNIAIAKKEGNAKLYLNKENDGCHSLLHELNPESEGMKVKTLDFDGFLAENGLKTVDLLKMDCEGAEMDILRGTKKLGAIKAIVMETNYPNFDEVKSILAKKGFTVSQIEDRPLLFALNNKSNP